MKLRGIGPDLNRLVGRNGWRGDPQSMFRGEPLLLPAEALLIKEADCKHPIVADRLRHLGDVGLELLQPRINVAFQLTAGTGELLVAQCQGLSRLCDSRATG